MAATLKVTVVEGQGLRDTDGGSKKKSGLFRKKGDLSDPFVVLQLAGQKFKTDVVKDNLDPKWDKTFTFELSKPLGSSDELQVQVYDHQSVGSNQLIGETKVNLAFLKGVKQDSQTYRIGSGDGRVKLHFDYNPGDAKDGGGAGVEEIDSSDPAQAAALARRDQARNASKSLTRSNSPLSSKKSEYQIRVRVIQARALQGAGSLDPVCKVTINGERKHTRRHRSTNAPYFNEILFFSFNEAPVKLFNELINLEVFNAKNLRSDSLLGAFKLDVGLVYDQPQHAIMRKWIMLQQPADAGCQGYLQVSMMVLGEGDDVPIEEPASATEDEDVESNLLSLPGAELDPVDLVVKLHVGEDLPQTDASLKTGIKFIDKLTRQEDKDECDPYVEVSFAGKKVKSSVVANSFTPQWLQELHLPISVPSMCSGIKLQVKDSDGGFMSNMADDIIATHTLLLREISSTLPDDLGFLPTFGPAFVNIYGAPREFKFFESDHAEALNLGFGEGCAYRGRVLLELASQPGEAAPDKPVADMSVLDMRRITMFQKRKAYKLRVELLDLNMLSEKVRSGELEVEVSQGLYGNKFEDTVPPGTSCTIPSRATFDGAHGWYLSWDSKKPCLELTTEWEDVDYRVHAVNCLRGISRQLRKVIKELQQFVQTNHTAKQRVKMYHKVVEALHSFQDDCRTAYDYLPSEGYTRLDGSLGTLRMRERSDALEASELLEMSLHEAREDGEQVLTEELCEELEYLCSRIDDIAYDPQISIPDVIIWLLCDSKRKAYFRVPVGSIMFHEDPLVRGECFGQTCVEYLKLPKAGPKKGRQTGDVPGQLQFRAWFGPSESVPIWNDATAESQGSLDGVPSHSSEMVVLAETYQNHRHIPLKGWGEFLLPTDPPRWSDRTGKKKQYKDDAELPPGWQWKGDWYIDPEIMEADPEASVDTVDEDAFQNQRYYPIRGWSAKLLPTERDTWTDMDGTETRIRQEILTPVGWKWQTEWIVDTDRAVDAAGWEYARGFDSEDWFPIKKRIHFVRRRRWKRTRVRDQDHDPNNMSVHASLFAGMAEEVAKVATDDPDHQGWEYGRDFDKKFHMIKKSSDRVRRRRWHREMTGTTPVEGTASDALYDLFDKAFSTGSYLVYKTPESAAECWQLRAHIYQARNVIAEDKSGLSDPYVVVTFGHHSGTTSVIRSSVCPTWDQTIVLDGILLPGSKEQAIAMMPRVVIELFDYDEFGDHDFLGRVHCNAQIRDKMSPRPGVLCWYDLERHGSSSGQLLATFEVVPAVDCPAFPLPLPRTVEDETSKRTVIKPAVPEDIRPEVRRARICILAWGLRNLSKYHMLGVDNPHVQLECGGKSVDTPKLKHVQRNPNFSECRISFEVDLPINEMYCPPLNIRVFDNRRFGRKPMVGVHSVPTLAPFVYKYFKPEDLNPPPVPDTPVPDETVLNLAPDCPPPSYAFPPQFDPVAETRIDDGIVPAPSQAAAASTGAVGSVTTYDILEEKEPLESETDAEDAPLLPEQRIDIPDVGLSAVHAEDNDFSNDTTDWWSKYFTSIGVEQRFEYRGNMLTVLPCPLEEKYDLEDLIHAFPLTRGTDDKREDVGVFKGALIVIPEPDDIDGDGIADFDAVDVDEMWATMPSSEPTEVIVRVYVIKGIDLQPKDSNGRSDAYVQLHLGGKKIVKDSKNYVPANVNPLFGMFYEFTASLPVQSELKLSLWDHDPLTHDDLIGETVVDLETRFLSSLRPFCGLAQAYSTAPGPSQWRDAQTPKEILQQYLVRMHLPPATYSSPPNDAAVTVAMSADTLRKTFRVPRSTGLWEDDLQNACLLVLRTLMVPEHVETRPLFDPANPELEQGKVQLWIDMFPKDGTVPEPVDISVRTPEKYQLRLVVWNCCDVVGDDDDGKMSDMYVKGFIRGLEKKKQKTDVHYRSLNGEGMFNWRMVFPIEYLATEDCLVTHKKNGFFDWEKEEVKISPVFAVQVWDNDLFTPDDYLGNMDLKLTELDPGFKDSDDVDLSRVPDAPERARRGQKSWWTRIKSLARRKTDVAPIDLFKAKRIRGWWPMTRGTGADMELSGKIELEIELLTEEEAEAKPVGLGRSDPNQFPTLEKPNRPATSFFWLTSPWKTFRYIIWGRYKWYFIVGLIVAVVIAFIVLLMYNVPHFTVSALFGNNKK
eukprot:m.141941 g.141941  ORF g.141941 m.141941 type:complete len:2152 (+) comp17129_c0_seq1:436-6891(+)